MMPAGERAVTRRGTVRAGLSLRELQVVELVGQFRIMTAEQIKDVVFTTQASKTPLDRTLRRLTASGHLRRLARFVGGFGGGSGQYVYQLGREGWRALRRGGTYRPLRVVDLHTLTIAECFVQLKRLEQGGELAVVSYQPEPSCHLTVGGVQLTPDAYTEIGDRRQGLKFRYWLEIDRDTENNETLKGKCVRYWKAYRAWGDGAFPYVAFVVPDAARAKVIERVIAGGPVEAQELFRVYLLDELAEVMHRNMLKTGVKCIDLQRSKAHT